MVVTAAILVAPGCRGSKPFGRFVKVTQEVDPGMPYVEPPQQRLATARSPMSQPAGSAAGNPAAPSETSPAVHGGVEVTMTAAEKPSPRQTLQQDPIRRSTASRDRQQASANRAKVAGRHQENRPQETPATSRNVAKAKMQPAQHSDDVEHRDLMDAFADYPPEVQREALRRLVAATSKTAKKTSQPSGFTAELKQQTDNLPELPEARNVAAEVPAQRLGTKSSPNRRRSSSVVTVADSSRSEKQKTRSKVESELTTTAIAEFELESAASEVQPVSAIQTSQAADNKIAQAAPLAKSPESSASLAHDSMPANEAKLSETGPAAVDVTSLSDEQLYQALVKQLSTAAKEETDAQRASRLIKLRHLMVLSGDVDSAVEKIDGMSESEQEFLRHQLLGLWTMVDPSGHPVASRRITTALPQLRQATQFAAAATDSLEVRRVSFCTEIESYGQIKPFKSNRFDVGQQVILYCEIENFTAKETSDGFATEIQGSYDIFDENNRKIVSQLLPADRQVSSNYLRDYYIAYQMHLPKQLAAGKYRLQLTMEDVAGKKYGQSGVEFEIVK
jgi:hypothetical protein